jgi:hypothetical protein
MLGLRGVNFRDDEPNQTPIMLIRDSTTDSYADSKEQNLRFLRPER